MRPILLIFWSLFLCFPGLLSAELYKYYDQKGALSFTDDLSMVPADQRPVVETIDEIIAKPDDAVTPGTQTAAESILGQPENNETPANGNALTSELDLEFKQLGSIKKELDDIYPPLKERQDKLISDGKRKMNTNEKKAYNQAIKELNQDTLKYREKMATYRKRVEAYNLKLKSVQ
jgi:hypothetical protein